MQEINERLQDLRPLYLAPKLCAASSTTGTEYLLAIKFIDKSAGTPKSETGLSLVRDVIAFSSLVESRLKVEVYIYVDRNCSNSNSFCSGDIRK